MPASSVLTFNDPDAYHAAIRDAHTEGIITGRGDFRAESTRIELDRVSLQRGEESRSARPGNCRGRQSSIRPMPTSEMELYDPARDRTQYDDVAAKDPMTSGHATAMSGVSGLERAGPRRADQTLGRL
jgi:hypothetical protein